MSELTAGHDFLPGGWSHDSEDVAEIEAAQESSGGIVPPALEVETAAELCARPDPSGGDELLGSLVVRGDRIVLGGHTGEGKTTMKLAIVRAIVTSREFLEWKGSGGRVLVIDAEQGLKTIKRRLREAGLADCPEVDYVRVPDGLSLDSDPQHVGEVERILQAGQYDVVAADPLYKLHRGDSNEERAAVDLMRRFDGWRAEFGFAFLLPVHCRKPIAGTKFSIHDLFGSSAYVRGAEVVLGLQRVAKGLSRLHFLKDRDGDLPIGETWELLFDLENGFRRKPDEPERDLVAEVEEFLRDLPCAPFTEIRESVKAGRDKVLDVLRSHCAQVACRSDPRHHPNAKCWALSKGSSSASEDEPGRTAPTAEGDTSSAPTPLFREEGLGRTDRQSGLSEDLD